MEKRLLQIGVLASGSGSNLQAIIDDIESGNLPAKIAVLIVNKSQAGAVERARKHGIPSLIISHKNFSRREDFDAALVKALQEHGVELVVLAGFMRVLSPVFFAAFPQRVMNIHPALLPAFPGVDAQEQAFNYGVRFAGCTVHFVDEGVDTGPIIIQAVVEVQPDDTRDSLAKKILAQEHRIYPQAIKLYAAGRLEIKGRKVIIRDCQTPAIGCTNPSCEEG
ncbi:MAG: phosphoribosylglycinamide formyltransferase [Deltaproteobacteria bacterium]|nr:phosphoribosylglycinamide formyltransferase [Deltaproteobacteria bacterium]